MAALVQLNRSLKSLAFSSLLVLGLSAPLAGKEVAESVSSFKMGVVNFKSCLEASKMGKDEQRRFEDMKKEIDKSLQEREKALNEISSKFNDEYLDSISEEAEADLKEQFRRLSQEFTFAQNQYYQLLNQTNMRMLQAISDLLAEASKEVAEKQKIDVVFSEDSFFYYKPALDVSAAIISVMDEMYEKQQKKEAAPQTTTAAPAAAKNKEA